MKSEKEVIEEVFKNLYEDLMPEAEPKPLQTAEHNRRARALFAQDRWAERQRELTMIARQRAIDAVWERTLAAKREEAERADDPEAQFEEMIWGPEKRMMRLAERRRRQDELAAREMSGTGEAVAEAIRRRMQRGQSHD